MLLGIKDNERGEALFEHYLKLRQKVEAIDLTKSYELLDTVAHEIFQELIVRKKSF